MISVGWEKDQEWGQRSFKSGVRDVARPKHNLHSTQPTLKLLQQRSAQGGCGAGFGAEGSVGAIQSTTHSPSGDCPGCLHSSKEIPNLRCTAEVRQGDTGTGKGDSAVPSTLPMHPAERANAAG